jgi:hypothetical protein
MFHLLHEAARGGFDGDQGGNRCWQWVEQLAATVPREDWQFLKPMTAYFGQFEYRRDSQTFVRITSA